MPNLEDFSIFLGVQNCNSCLQNYLCEISLMKWKKFNIFNILFFYSIKIKLVNLKFILEIIKRPIFTSAYQHSSFSLELAQTATNLDFTTSTNTRLSLANLILLDERASFYFKYKHMGRKLQSSSTL